MHLHNNKLKYFGAPEEFDSLIFSHNVSALSLNPKVGKSDCDKLSTLAPIANTGPIQSNKT